MRVRGWCGLVMGMVAISGAMLRAQAVMGTAPVFEATVAEKTFTLAGGAPERGQTTTIPTVLVPVRLEFAAGGVGVGAKGAVMDAEGDVARVVGSPIFAKFGFLSSNDAHRPEETQYGDALLRATFATGERAGKVKSGWHVLLGKPEVRPVVVKVPVGYGYVLHAKSSGRSLGVADGEFVQRAVMEQIGRQDGKLVMAVVHNTAFYAAGDATVCCTWGAHGVDSAGTADEKGGGTGNSFVMGAVLRDAPGVVADADVEPLTEQLAMFLMDPLHDPTVHERRVQAPGNVVPAWMRPGAPGCAGAAISSAYYDLLPTDTNEKNNFPASRPYAIGTGAGVYRVANVPLLAWYTGASDALGSAMSFPDAQALTEPATACAARPAPGAAPVAYTPKVAPVAQNGKTNGHALIGYWNGHEGGAQMELREVPPQWDYVLVAFATPAKDAPEGTMRFQAPRGIDPDQLKKDIATLKGQGRKVMVSLGGGGEHFALADAAHIPTFVQSVTQIVTEWGFDGVDIDFEIPSLAVDPGDTDFRHPTTPGVVNIITALKQLRRQIGPKFLISLVPEGTQTPGGYPSYGGQFGSYLPLVVGLGEDLTFVDTQSYNTPPLEGLDGEIYQPGTVDYHAAMTELLLQGFAVGGDPQMRFAAVPAKKVAVGFWTADTTPEIVQQAMRYLITGKAPAGTHYKLRRPAGYPEMLGAMFWTIDGDWKEDYRFSNVVGPELHGFAARR